MQKTITNVTNWNIFFTLFLSLLGMYGLKERKWWLFALALFTVSWWNFDYSGTGIQLMLIFYLCRQKPALGALLYALSYLPALWGGSPEDPLACHLGPLWISFEFFALLALPLIFFRTRTGLRIPKWFFYGYYPAHLLAIFLSTFLPVFTSTSTMSSGRRRSYSTPLGLMAMMPLSRSMPLTLPHVNVMSLYFGSSIFAL